MRLVKHQGSDIFLLAALWNVPLAIDIEARASRKSSIFLRRIVGAMFMRVNSRCAHQLRPPLAAITSDARGEIHSYLSASVGSMCVARRTGT